MLEQYRDISVYRYFLPSVSITFFLPTVTPYFFKCEVKVLTKASGGKYSDTVNVRGHNCQLISAVKISELSP